VSTEPVIGLADDGPLTDLDATTGELATSLRAAFGAELGSRVWPALLTPQRAGVVLHLPEDAVQLQHSVLWRSPVPGRFELRTRKGRTVAASRGADVSFTVSAVRSGEEIARVTYVIRCPSASAPTGGDPLLPPMPVISGNGTPRGRYTVDERAVLAYADVLGAHPAVHVDAEVARRLGYPGVLVQGVRLLTEQLAAVGDPVAGEAQMWFRRPVTADAEVELREHPDGVWSHRLAPDGPPAAIARVHTH
jgi:hypothetical protein